MIKNEWPWNKRQNKSGDKTSEPLSAHSITSSQFSPPPVVKLNNEFHPQPGVEVLGNRLRRDNAASFAATSTVTKEIEARGPVISVAILQPAWNWLRRRLSNGYVGCWRGEAESRNSLRAIRPSRSRAARRVSDGNECSDNVQQAGDDHSCLPRI